MNEKAHQLFNLKKTAQTTRFSVHYLHYFEWCGFRHDFFLSLSLSLKLSHYVINTKLQAFKLALKPSANSNTNIKDEFVVCDSNGTNRRKNAAIHLHWMLDAGYARREKYKYFIFSIFASTSSAMHSTPLHDTGANDDEDVVDDDNDDDAIVLSNLTSNNNISPTSLSFRINPIVHWRRVHHIHRFHSTKQRF